MNCTNTKPIGEVKRIEKTQYTETQTSKCVSIPMCDILVGKRLRRNQPDLAVLKENIKKNGLLQPIGVSKAIENGKYNLVFGNSTVPLKVEQCQRFRRFIKFFQQIIVAK